MVEEVGELELGDRLPEGKLREPKKCEDIKIDLEKGALAILI